MWAFWVPSTKGRQLYWLTYKCWLIDFNAISNCLGLFCLVYLLMVQLKMINFLTDLFDQWIASKQILPLWVRVDLGVMIMKELLHTHQISRTGASLSFFYNFFPLFFSSFCCTLGVFFCFYFPSFPSCSFFFDIFWFLHRAYSFVLWSGVLLFFILFFLSPFFFSSAFLSISCLKQWSPVSTLFFFHLLLFLLGWVGLGFMAYQPL